MRNVERSHLKISTSIAIIAILLALLIHLALLYLIYSAHQNISPFRSIMPEIMLNKKQVILQNTSPQLPELRAPASSFGKSQHQAQVIFQDPSPPLTAPPTDITQKQPPKKVSLKKISDRSPATISSPTASPAVTSETPQSYHPSTNLSYEDHLTSAPPPPTQTTPTNKKTSNPFLPHYHQMKTAQLKNIGQGFLEAMEKGGNDALNMKGEQREPTFEDLKMITYVQKLIHALQSSFKSDATWVTLTHDEHVESKAQINIDQEGNITSLTLNNPPENKILDRHVRELIYQAAPFAPIPKHLNISRFNLPLSISISLSQGTHRMQWQCE